MCLKLWNLITNINFKVYKEVTTNSLRFCSSLDWRRVVESKLKVKSVVVQFSAFSPVILSVLGNINLYSWTGQFWVFWKNAIHLMVEICDVL